MSLSQALDNGGERSARHADRSLASVSANVANAETPGYVRKTSVQVATATGDSASASASMPSIASSTSTSSGSCGSKARAQATPTCARNSTSRLQSGLRRARLDYALETMFNNFTTAAQTLSTSPDSASARCGVLSTAQVLAQQLNGMTADIQGLRSDAELGPHRRGVAGQRRDAADRRRSTGSSASANRRRDVPRRCSTSATATSTSSRS